MFYHCIEILITTRCTSRQSLTEPFERHPHETVKHTQTICRQIANELFECVSSFCGIGF